MTFSSPAHWLTLTVDTKATVALNPPQSAVTIADTLDLHWSTMENISSPLKTFSRNLGNNLSCLENRYSYDESPSSRDGSTRLGCIIKSKPNMNCRRKREFISDEKKDASYWEKRRKNNEAAKRSREKRRLNDMVLENRVIALNDENVRLRTELLQLKMRFGLIGADSFGKKSQQLGGRDSAVPSTFASAQRYTHYSSCPRTTVNSDSSETEHSAQGKRHRPLLKYSPQGSLSDMSDGSSRDSPETVAFEIKQEADSLETDFADGCDAQVVFNIRHHLARLPALGQSRLHSQGPGAPYFSLQQPQDPDPEPETSASTLPPASLSQRSIILYGSRSAAHPGEALAQLQKQSSSGRAFKPIAASLGPTEEDLQRKLQHYPVHPLAEAGPGEQPRRRHRSQQTCEREMNPCTHPEAGGRSHRCAPLLHTRPYLSARDEEAPLLIYHDQPRNRPSSSSSSGDPPSSDKDASTDEEESPTSSCHGHNPGGVRRPAGPPPSSQLSFQSRAEVKATALPHKLRLKHRATGGGGGASGQEPPTSRPSAAARLPQQARRAVGSQQLSRAHEQSAACRHFGGGENEDRGR